MSDSSSLGNIAAHQALTGDMMLGLKPSAPRSRAYRVSIAPNNKQVFGPTDCIYIDIPTSRPNTWYDPAQSFLKFSVQTCATAACNATDGVYVDNTAYSYFSRLDIYNGSNLLETIGQYGALCNTILDATLTESDKAGLSCMIGSNPLITIINPTNAALGAYGASNACQSMGDRSGLMLNAAAIAGGLGAALPQTFCLPLMSGIVGVNASKMIPVGSLRAPISLQIYTAANDDAIFYGLLGVGATWQIINVEFVATYVEILDDNFAQHFDPTIPQYISTKSWRESSFSVPAGTAGENTSLLSFRMASITNILGRFRNQATAVQGVTASAAYRLSSSINPSMAYYYFKVGSQIYPNKPVYLFNTGLTGNGGEAFAELLKSFHSLDTVHGNSAITYPQYNVSAVAIGGNWTTPFIPSLKARGAYDTANNGFCIGQEFESFCHKSDTILSGLSTLNTNLFFTYGVAAGATTGLVGITAEFYAQYDLILVLQDGYISAKY